MRPSLIRTFFLISFLEGLLAFAALYRIPSESESALLFGFSPARLALGGLVFGLALALGGVAYGAFRAPGFAEKLASGLDFYFVYGDRLLVALFALSAATLGCGILLALPDTSLARHIGSLAAVVERARYVLLWGGILSLQGLAALAWSYRETIGAAGFWRLRALGKPMLALTVLAASVLHWSVLFFRLQIWTQLPGWYWNLRLNETAGPLWLFPILLGLVAVAAWALERFKIPSWLAISALGILGIGIQVGFGVMEGGGYEALRLKYVESEHRVYAGHAADRPSLGDVIGDYEARYGNLRYVETKPPGVIAWYVIFQRISAVFWPEDTFDGRFERLTALISFVFPVIAYLVLPPLARLARQLKKRGLGLPAALIFICLPNVVLIPLFLDQVLYPFLFVSTALLVVLAFTSGNWLWGLAGGLALYAALFFSFSLLPLGLLTLAYAGLKILFSRKPTGITRILKQVGWIAGGFALSHIFFLIALGYDMPARLSRALSLHQVHRGYGEAGQFWLSLLVANLDFAVWVGFPVAILALAAVLRSAGRAMRKTSTEFDLFALAIGATYLGLVFGGETRSEVGRLWLFITPMLAILSAQEARRLFHKPAFGVGALAALQLVTTFLTFRYQDFFA